MASKACRDGGSEVNPGTLGEGVETMLGDLPMYCPVPWSGPPTSTVAVIVVYDIFAFNISNTRAQCDRLAAEGFRVVMPDFYRGGVSPMQDPSLGDFGAWVSSGHRAWDSVEKDLEAVSASLIGEGATSVVVLGFCWGGYIAALAAATGKYACAIGIHAALKLSGEESGAALVAQSKCPLMFLQAGNDPDLRPTYEALKAVPDLAESCAWYIRIPAVDSSSNSLLFIRE